MLFQSPTFLLGFLPITLVGFYLVGRLQRAWASALWLTVASLVFYSWWRLSDLAVLGGSIAANYALAEFIRRGQAPGPRRAVLIGGVTANLLLLAYLKYTGFLVGALAALLGTGWTLANPVLPLAVSFFTFTQIAYLVDAARGKTDRYSFLDYCLFVTFFPHLIAGPITHYWQLLPQIKRIAFHPDRQKLTAGATVLLIGLAEKVLIADYAATYANPLFAAAAGGARPALIEAWVGALAFTLQIYFDFAGYSDMAIGLALLFGFRLPLNFDAPYRSASIVEFWRRWHITLSSFLRDYLYIGLGGNRRGRARRYANLFATMLLGGLWHGAGWTFVAWGALHGGYLVVNHAWRAVAPSAPRLLPPALARLASVALTFLCVVVGWVFFRADGFAAALAVLGGMAGLNGLTLPLELEGLAGALRGALPWLPVGFGELATGGLRDHAWFAVALVACYGLVWLGPTTAELMAGANPTLESIEAPGRLRWRPGWRAGLVAGLAVFLVALRLAAAPTSQFIYFNF
jgi:D-alanyl-lipoteichoic acid acyltransferase DltB (MBOAT superfamily)